MPAYVRFTDGHASAWGQVVDDRILRLSSEPWHAARTDGSEYAVGSVSLLPPVTPGKVVLVGLNYTAHVAESKSAQAVPEEPVIFLKPVTAVIGPGAAIVRPAGVERVDYEAELAVVIGKRIHRPSVDEAADAVFGATCLNDVTARPLQRRDVQWTRAKGFDTFCPVGPRLVTGLELQNLSVQSYVNGALRQDGRTRDQIWPVVDLVQFIARVMTLEPGDLISTGTPEGVGPLVAGDTVEIRIEGIGSLTNPVEDQP